MRAVVLAAGRGTRLLPLTKYVAKALLPVRGGPIIEKVLEGLLALSPEEVTVVTGHKEEQVREYLGDGSRYGIKIRYKTQKTPEGMAKALELAMKEIDEDVVVSACDSLVPKAHLMELWRYHLAEECDATLSLKRLGRSFITESSSVKFEEDGAVSKIIEKPAKEEILSEVASSPLYVFSEVVKEYLPKVKKSKRGEYEIQDAVQRMIEGGLTVKGIISDSWIHLSSIEDFLLLNFDYTKRWLERGF